MVAWEKKWEDKDSLLLVKTSRWHEAVIHMTYSHRLKKWRVNADVISATVAGTMPRSYHATQYFKTKSCAKRYIAASKRRIDNRFFKRKRRKKK